MTVSRFLRWCELKDEWEDLAPGEAHYRRWSWIWLGIAVSLIIAAWIFTAWLYIPMVIALICNGRAQFISDVAVRERRDLLAEMRGLAYEPH